MQIFKPKKNACHDMCIWMFSITLPHFAELYEFLCMMSAIVIFEESSFIFSFVRYGLVTRSLEAGGKESKKFKRWMWIFLQPNSDESSHLVSRRQNPLKLLYSIIILNTISLHYKAEPIKELFIKSRNKISAMCIRASPLLLSMSLWIIKLNV